MNRVRPVRIELLGDAREAAHVGEHHGDLALLAAELQQLGMAGDPLDHVGRQVEAEGAADRRALALGAHEGERRAADVDRRQGHRRIDRIEQQVDIPRRQATGTTSPMPMKIAATIAMRPADRRGSSTTNRRPISPR